MGADAGQDVGQQHLDAAPTALSVSDKIKVAPSDVVGVGLAVLTAGK